jgi:hypothetical protein
MPQLVERQLAGNGGSVTLVNYSLTFVPDPRPGGVVGARG